MTYQVLLAIGAASYVLLTGGVTHYVQLATGAAPFRPADGWREEYVPTSGAALCVLLTPNPLFCRPPASGRLHADVPV